MSVRKICISLHGNGGLIGRRFVHYIVLILRKIQFASPVSLQGLQGVYIHPLRAKITIECFVGKSYIRLVMLAHAGGLQYSSKLEKDLSLFMIQRRSSLQSLPSLPSLPSLCPFP